MKKRFLCCICTVLTICINSLAYANSTDDRTIEMLLNMNGIQEISNRGEIYYAKEVNPYDEQEVEESIILMGLMPETADAIRTYSEKCRTGEIKDANLIINSMKNPFKSSRETYKGYGNRNYMQESIEFHNTTDIINVNDPMTWTEYCDQVLENIVFYTAGETLSKVTLGVWDILEIFGGIESQIASPNTEVTHRACLVENGISLFTYIENDDGSLSFGCKSSMAEGYYENYIVTPGQSPIKAETVPMDTFETDSYSNPDKAAYYAYVNGGVTEGIDHYIYGEAIFESADR